MAVPLHLRVLFTVLMLLGIGLNDVKAGDPDLLQDFCVADLFAAVTSPVNGFPCVAPELVTTEDFGYSGLANAANLTGNHWQGYATLGFVHEWPALNTQGLGLVRLDINPGGIILPHTHNLATEILICLEGEIYTGFVTNSNNAAVPNKLYSKVVKPGQAFMYPRGLVHFQLNNGTKPAVSINVLNGQNPGIQVMPIALFGTGIDPEVLEKAFSISEAEVANMAALFTPLAG